MTDGTIESTGKRSVTREVSPAFIYRRLFIYASLQFCGHIEEYFAARTEKLVVFLVLPRVNQGHNLIRVYARGVLVSERTVRSSQNLCAYYALWLVNHWRILLGQFERREPFAVLATYPIPLLGMGLQRLLRRVRFAYWPADYFLPISPSLRLFGRAQAFCNRHADWVWYVSDAINRKLNGVVCDRPERRTVMYGVKPFPAAARPPPEPFHLLFVGLLKPGQGIESLFAFLRNHPAYRLSLIGVGAAAVCATYRQLLADHGLADRVFFPNRFYSESELLAVARECHVGVAFYDLGPLNGTHFADPGKIKSYLEMGLPVAMTRISGIVPFIEQTGCGEVIARAADIGPALEKIRANYAQYRQGVERFNDLFEYRRHYQQAFAPLEE